MHEIWSRTMVRSDGKVMSIDAFSRKELEREILRPRRQPVYGKRGIFTHDRMDSGDIRMLKDAVAVMGGASFLALKLGVERATLYAWLRAGKISDKFRDRVKAIGCHWVLENEGD
jgi:hypothetical protein